MRCFENIAKLIRTRRINHPKGYSQSELSHLLGYKNGQFISNVERALCNIPLKMLGRVSEVLDITREELKEAILQDHSRTLENYLNLSNANNGVIKTEGGIATNNNVSNTSNVEELSSKVVAS